MIVFEHKSINYSNSVQINIYSPKIFAKKTFFETAWDASTYSHFTALQWKLTFIFELPRHYARV